MYQQLWGYKVEEKLHLGVREQKRLNTTALYDTCFIFRRSFLTPIACSVSGFLVLLFCDVMYSDLVLWPMTGRGVKDGGREWEVGEMVCRY
jgi:hypothetical protein